MYKITVTDIETGAIRQEATGECIIAAASTRLAGRETEVSIIRVCQASSLTIANAIYALAQELGTICADDVDIATAYLYVEALSKSREAREEAKENE